MPSVDTMKPSTDDFAALFGADVQLGPCRGAPCEGWHDQQDGQPDEKTRERPHGRCNTTLDSRREGGKIGPKFAKGQAAMKWETPAFVEINMSAEIGGYQSDFSDRDPRDPVVQIGQDRDDAGASSDRR